MMLILVLGVGTAGATTYAAENSPTANDSHENTQSSTSTESDVSGESETKLEAGATLDNRVAKFFEQIKQLRALKKFSYAMISEIIEMPLETQSVHMYSATGDLKTDVLDTAEVSHGRDEKDITLICLYPAKDLNITVADIEKALGKGMTSPPMKAEAELSEKFGYKEEIKLLYRKGKLNINFEVITSPKERVHKVAFYKN